MRTARKGQHKLNVSTRFSGKVVKKPFTTTTADTGTSRKMSGKIRKCLACRKTFTSQWKLMDHYCLKSKPRKKYVDSTVESLASHAKSRHLTRTHSAKINLSCSVCEENFYNATDLKAHISTHTQSEESKMYICNVCKQMFETIDEWKDHIQQSANASHCDQCGQNFGCVTAKMQHKCTVPAIFVCLLCKANFKRNWVLKRHMLYQHTNFQCNICNKKFGSRSLYKGHLLTHKKVNLKNLSRKNRELNRKALNTNSKRETRSSNEQRQKGQCTPISAEEVSLTAESQTLAVSFPKMLKILPSKLIKADGPISPRSVSFTHRSRTCDSCHKLFRSFKLLKMHRRFRCNKVSQITDTSSLILEKVNSCGKGKSSPTSNLKNELLVTKVFKCRSCPKTYRSEKQLQLHKKVHKLVNLQLSCKKCGRQFWSKSHYADHMLLHARKQLKCDVCCLAMSSFAQLRIHRASHFATKKESKISSAKHVYDCNHCHQLYSSLKDFEDHYSTLNLNIHASKIVEYVKPNESCETSCYVEECAELLASRAAVIEPTESAGLPEEAKESREVTKIGGKNYEVAKLPTSKIEDNQHSECDASDLLCPLLNEHNKIQDIVTAAKDASLNKAELYTEFVTSSNDQSNDQEYINETGNLISSADKEWSTPEVSKYNPEIIINPKEQAASKVFFNGLPDDISIRKRDVEQTVSISHNLMANNLQGEDRQLNVSNLTHSLHSPVEMLAPNVEKQRRYSPLDRSIVAVYVKQLVRDGISEISPHVCSFCGKVFQKPQGINNHYLMKHTSEEIECLATQSYVANKFLSTNETEKKAATVIIKSTVINSPLENKIVIKSNDVDCSSLSGSSVVKNNAIGFLNSSKASNKPSEDKQSFSQQTCDHQMLQSIVSNSTCLNKNNQPEALLTELRLNFSKLFCHLVGDSEVLFDLGWPHRLIDEVLIDVITRCDLKPSCENCKLTCLRENILTLLKICIKEQAMESFGWKTKLVDSVVKEMLAGGDIAAANQ